MYDNGFTNDKLPLLFQEYVNAKVAVKVASGITRPMTISNVIMQGTVWASLFCTATMDKLEKLMHSIPEMMYQDKGVPIPPLGMIDDVMTVTSVEQTSNMNKIVNTFMEHKNLKLSKTKCHRIHIGIGHENCPNIKVHDELMKTLRVLNILVT